MSHPPHYVIIGAGAAGCEAALHLRQRDPCSRITLIAGGKLLFINRYELPKVFHGVNDWRELLVHPPEFYDEQRITLRRDTWVTRVDPKRRVVGLRHMEWVAYSKLLVASGGGGYLTEDLREFRSLMNGFATFEDAIRVRQALPKKGTVIMLGGDMMGLDLARTLVGAGFKVTLIAGEQLFWPHNVKPKDAPGFVAALKHMGLEVVLGRKVAGIKAGTKEKPSRRVILDDSSDLYGDAVMPFCGLMPSLEFMVGAGVDIERGLLVNPRLQTTNSNIWAGGDVCQIWSPEENRYRFYYGWKHVKEMGRVAAFNMTGGDEAVRTYQEDELFLNDKGEIDSPLWEFD
ncbi:MAG TPA: FAD-dependent oxidoreductase [Rhodospirillales bacterium]|jgi:NAD(P)H-nitrite reductase large subunit|nr:hypothetical protein [Rhodospirillaceae bacterium]HJN23190.1 FAD-dependent oxidoreductase [Rhodospirillales bacterium]